MGQDAALWFTENGGNKIGRVTTAGVFSEYPVPTSSGAPLGITAGPDGALWFTEENGNKVGRITTAGVFNEYNVPTSASQPGQIVAGPDGALWFTELAGNKIGKITTAGVISEFVVPTSGTTPFGIAAGPDGALWFTEFAGNKIGRITTAGTISEVVVTTSGASPLGVAAGSDGALWFTESLSSKIGRAALTVPAFFIGEVSLGSGVYYLQFPDGNLFGYYNFLSSSIFYHYDMGYEAFIPGSAADIYLYDFTSSHWWYTSSTLFPYLYDFTLTDVALLLPDTKNPGHYTTNPRYFSNLTTGQIFTM